MNQRRVSAEASPDLPVAMVSRDHRFSIVWEGTFTPTQTGNFVVYGGSDDGIRVYLNGVPVVDAFVDRGYTETPSGPLALTAGEKYDLRVEYYENYGGAGASLKYEGPGTNGRQVIPFTELSPPTAAQPLRPPIDIALTHAADCVTVWFHDISASETGYEVLRTVNPRGGWTSVGTTPPNADHFVDSGPLLSDGTSYYYLVQALGPNGAMSLGAGLPDPVTPTPPGGPVDYANFWDNGAEDAFTFNGSATLVDRDQDRAGTTERLMLTDAVDGQDGSAYLYSPMSVDGFTAGFDFQVTDSNGADGFTFILQSARNGAAALGLAGGGLGYAGIRNSVAVKYDFYPGINQTGLYVDGQDITDDSADPRNRDVQLDFDFDNGQVYRAKVSYDANSKVLTQTIDDIGNPATAPFVATYPIDIPAVIGKCAYVGFTGATGGLHARQEILSFKYTNYVPPPPRGPRVQNVYVSGTG